MTATPNGVQKDMMRYYIRKMNTDISLDQANRTADSIWEVHRIYHEAPAIQPLYQRAITIWGISDTTPFDEKPGDHEMLIALALLKHDAPFLKNLRSAGLGILDPMRQVGKGIVREIRNKWGIA